MNSAYNEHSPVTSCDWGVFVSATWGSGGVLGDTFPKRVDRETVLLWVGDRAEVLPNTPFRRKSKKLKWLKSTLSFVIKAEGVTLSQR